ncbi:serum paraoxonase/arylesterase [Lactifluus subvellereus]|nr:serum paraoxonase/arylesterase [Lactifluus subvellereus]
MGRTLLTSSAILAVLLAVYYQVSLKAILTANGIWRVIEPVGNTNCKKEEALQACEKIVLHPPTGILYLACSTRASRRHWIPALGVLEDDKLAFDDYIATYDPATDTVTRLAFEGFPTPQGYSAHGMDVVPSASDPRELYVYAINHRKPVQGPGKRVGADSVVEIFKTKVGGNTLTHVKTVEDSVIDTPNDVIGYSDGRGFYFTNDHGVKVGVSRFLEFFGLSRTSVGYCHVDDGCKIAISGLHGSNGIARAPNGTVYVANSKFGEIRVLEEQSNYSLVLTDAIALDRLVDNLSIDENGALWAATIPSALRFLSAYHDFEKVAPSSAFRITKNVGEKAFFGEKLKVEKVFEDDGTQASAITSVAHDAKRNILFLSGVFSAHLTVCKAP